MVAPSPFFLSCVAVALLLPLFLLCGGGGSSLWRRRLSSPSPSLCLSRSHCWWWPLLPSRLSFPLPQKNNHLWDQYKQLWREEVPPKKRKEPFHHKERERGTTTKNTRERGEVNHQRELQKREGESHRSSFSVVFLLSCSLVVVMVRPLCRGNKQRHRDHQKRESGVRNHHMNERERGGTTT